MYCDKCKVNIVGKTDKCPLCHSPLTKKEQNSKLSEQQKPFPTPQPIKINGKSFTYIFILVLAVILAPCIAINLHFNPDFLWCVIVFIVLTYIGFFIRTVIIGRYRFIRNLTAQTFMLTIVCFAINAITKGNFWILIYYLPAIFVLSYSFLLGYIRIRSYELATASIIHSYFLCILGQIPIITAFCMPLSSKIPSIISSALGAVFFISITIFYRKHIITEIKKFFHL